jgi:hypothetical protein
VIGESLHKCASLVEEVGPGAWDFVLNNGSMLLVTARADEQWLHLDAPVADERSGTRQRQDAKYDAWQLLKLNCGLGGLSKVALMPGQSTPRVRAEIPLDEEVDLARRLREACAGLKTAAGKLHGEKTREQIAVRPASGATDEESSAVLKRLCEESGWKFTERSGPTLAVDLETRSGFYQAQVAEQFGGAISLTAELTAAAAPSEQSKQAIAGMLLRASGLVKLSRATIKETEAGATASFEVLFQTPPCAAEFGHGLSALAVACGLCGHAGEAMWDEVVARHYLAAQYSSTDSPAYVGNI